MRVIRRFIEEEERVGGKDSAGHGIAPGKETRSKTAYQVAEQPSPVVREEEFAKQLRIARYLAGAGVPAARTLEPAAQPRTPKPARAVSKARTGTKKETPRQKAAEAELAKERRRAGRVSQQKLSSSGSQRSEKRRPSPGR
jgi:hypothetical protein